MDIFSTVGFEAHYLPYLAFAFLLASALYASVGHGGASAYLAVMGLLGFSPEWMKPVALVLNIAVSLVATLSFFRAGHFKGELFWPLVSVSVPTAFLGGWLNLPDPAFNLILAAALTFGAWRLLCLPSPDESTLRKPDGYAVIVMGVGIGALSGLVGIGGGIFLTPLLIMFRWTSSKTAAGISAAFIFANSLAGLSGFVVSGGVIPNEIFLLLPFVLVGGWLGARWGSGKACVPALRRSLAAVLVLAAAKFLII